MLNLLRHNLSDCSKQTKSTAYLSLVRPLIEYASCVWDPHYDSHVLELQHRAARWVFSDYNYNTRVTTLFTGTHYGIEVSMLNLHYFTMSFTVTQLPDYYVPMQSSTIIYDLFHI